MISVDRRGGGAVDVLRLMLLIEIVAVYEMSLFLR